MEKMSTEFLKYVILCSGNLIRRVFDAAVVQSAQIVREHGAQVALNLRTDRGLAFSQLFKAIGRNCEVPQYASQAIVCTGGVLDQKRYKIVHTCAQPANIEDYAHAGVELVLALVAYGSSVERKRALDERHCAP